MFTLVYAQSPLFTSNQNQYLLHGLAQARYGFLNQDWLTNTVDPTPIFSKMVQISYELFHWTPIFYIFYGLILGVYLFSLTGIVYRIFKLDQEKGTFTLLAAIFFVNSAAIRYFLSRVFQPDWAFLLEGGLANQRVLGQVFQPSVFGVFLILSIYLFIIDKPILAVLAAAFAVYFHPTYLLSYVILVPTFLLVNWIEKRDFRSLLISAVVAFLVVLPIIMQVYSVFDVGTTQVVQRAREILVNYRIPHHAVISNWFDLSSFIQIGIMCIGIVLTRRTKLFGVLLVGTMIAFLITLVQLLTKNDALALLFPWRISVIFMPISVALILGASISRLFNRFPDFWKQHSQTVRITNVILMVCLATIGFIRFSIEYQEKTKNNESGLYSFVRDTKTSNDTYLIPIKDQDFRLETGAPVYVEFKSIPYLAEEVLEWYQRVQNAQGIYKEKRVSCSDLNELTDDQDITRVVFETINTGEICPEWTLSYRDNTYQVWRLNQ